jgi:hypothetical protein
MRNFIKINISEQWKNIWNRRNSKYKKHKNFHEEIDYDDLSYVDHQKLTHFFIKIEKLTKIDRSIIKDAFKKYSYQYGNDERYWVSLIKFLIILLFGFISLFKAKPNRKNVDMVFDASIKRLSFSEVYMPIIEMFPMSQWILLVRDRNILPFNKITNSIVFQQKTIFAKYITSDVVTCVISILLLRIRFGMKVPINHYFLFIQEYLYFEYLTSIIKTKVFVSFRDSTFTPTMYGIFKKNGITGITLQHGFYMRTDVRKNMKYNYYQYFFTFSDMQSKIFLNTYQAKIDCIKSFGSPILNNKILKLENKNSFDICFIEEVGEENLIRLDEMILLLGTVLEYAKYNELSMVYCNRYCRTKKNLNKKWLNEKLDKIDLLLDCYPFIVRSDDSYQSIFNSKLTVTKHSTMGLEAIGMKKNVLICDFHASTGLYPKKNKLFFVYDMSEDAIINGLEEIFTADSEYLNAELERIKSYYMNTNPSVYFNSIKNIISNDPVNQNV